MNKNSPSTYIIGGGAAGHFASIFEAQNFPQSRVVILEASSKVLQKVKISGGGRCNVTHYQLNPRELAKNYPRGSKELLSVFSRFDVSDTISWFEQNGVSLKVEADGRMFSKTDSSQTIIDTLTAQAKKLGVTVIKKHAVEKITKEEDGTFKIYCEQRTFTCSKVIMATGSAKKGFEIARNLGHKIIAPVPSLFTFKINHSLLKDLAGISFSHVQGKLSFAERKEKFTQLGDLLITHWGLSGPAILKLSAFAARELYENGYRAKLNLDFFPQKKINEIEGELHSLKQAYPMKRVMNLQIDILPKKFWKNFCEFLKISAETKSCDLSPKMIQQIAFSLKNTFLPVSGKGVFKEEFVTCGGVDLKEINFKKMESKIVPGLFFIGEILNIDGITGGFNFQNAWSTGYIAGHHS